MDVNPIPSGSPGTTVTTTVTLSNNGSTTVTFTPVVVINGVTTTLAPVTLAPGQTQSAPITVPLTTTGATVTANVTAPSVPDSNPANNTDTELGGAQFADVSTEVDLPTTAPAGSVVTVTVTFTNSAAAGTTASATVGTVTLSNGDVRTFTVGDLAPGASVTQTFTTTVPSTIGAVLEATSTVATTTPESSTANNSDVDNQAGGEQTTPLFSDPGVDVNPIPSGSPGTTVTTTVTLSNNGSTTVTFTAGGGDQRRDDHAGAGDAGAWPDPERADHGAADDHRSDRDGQRHGPQRARQQPGQQHRHRTRWCAIC